jgi:hypothetical protein
VDFYTFALESIHIDNTRSRHEDTDLVTFALQATGHQFPAQLHGTGNVNNGDYGVNLKFGVMLLSDTDEAVMSYEIYNGDVSAISNQLNALAKSLLTQQSTSLGIGGVAVPYPNISGGQSVAAISGLSVASLLGNTTGWYAAVAKSLATDAINFLFPNCDGFVAADAIGLRKSNWDSAIDGAGGSTFRKSMQYGGSNSPSGCGSNSSYTVTWSVTRERIGGGLREFLRSHELTATSGLRSLSGQVRTG